MGDISAALREFVIARANNCCEYCQLSQIGQEATFHIDHVKPRVGGGLTAQDNLALACVSCSLRKGARETAPDPKTSLESPLFNPRKQVWKDHFRWEHEIAVPLTSTGRATVAALALNRPIMHAIRREEALRGRHPK
jgi:HNH endonuclease